MTFDRLITQHDIYLATQTTLPYDPDKVQAQGLLFASIWNGLKDAICKTLDEEPDDFDYGKWRSWVPRLK